MTDTFATRQEVADFITLFEDGVLPRARWTHRGHLTAGFWYLTLHPLAVALSTMRVRIRRHNEAVGTFSVAARRQWVEPDLEPLEAALATPARG